MPMFWAVLALCIGARIYPWESHLSWSQEKVRCVHKYLQADANSLSPFENMALILSGPSYQDSLILLGPLPSAAFWHDQKQADQ